MESMFISAAIWLAKGAGTAAFTVAQQYLLNRLGLGSSKDAVLSIKPLLDDYLQLLTKRLDEDRIAKLHGAFSKLEDAPKSIAMQGLLVEALDSFHEVARIPQQGLTGGHSNAELRCMAFLGMAASYNLLGDQPELIAEKMVEAIHADGDTAKRWLGEDIVNRVISFFPSPGIICPKCGFQNPSGSRFCNQDGYPLTQRQNPILEQAPLPSPSETNPFASWGRLAINGRSNRVFASRFPTDLKSQVSYLGNTVTLSGEGIGIRLVNAKRQNVSEDFAIQVEVTFLSSNANSTNLRGGIFYRLIEKIWAIAPRYYYYFSVSGDDNYSLDYIEGKKGLNIATGPAHIKINTPVRMGVLVQRNRFDLYLDEQHLATVEDYSTKSSGYLGVAIGDLNTHCLTEARFRNLIVWEK